jgi:integrase
MKIFLDVNQIKKLITLADNTRINTGNGRDLVLFNLSFCTGLRISDLLQLKRVDFYDSDNEVVRNLRIRMKKTKQWIDRPLRKDCRDAVSEYLAWRHDNNPYLFPVQRKNQYPCTNSPMSRMAAHRIYKKYLGMLFPASMIVRASTHTARRSMGKIISQKSGRIEPASRFLGHKSTASTAAYIDMDGHEETANSIVTGIEL